VWGKVTLGGGAKGEAKHSSKVEKGLAYHVFFQRGKNDLGNHKKQGEGVPRKRDRGATQRVSKKNSSKHSLNWVTICEGGNPWMLTRRNKEAEVRGYRGGKKAAHINYTKILSSTLQSGVK